jgi:hypothetical protein
MVARTYEAMAAQGTAPSTALGSCLRSEGKGVGQDAEAKAHSERVGVAARRERCHDQGAEVGVQLVRGDHHAGSGLSNLAATGRVEIDEEDIPATDPCYRQRHSFSSNRVEVGLSSSRSSPSSRMRLAYAASSGPSGGVPIASTGTFDVGTGNATATAGGGSPPPPRCRCSSAFRSSTNARL